MKYISLLRVYSESRTTKFMMDRMIPQTDAKIVWLVEIAKLRIILELEENLIRGIRAKGSCKHCKMFR